MNACPMNIVFREPKGRMIIGIGQAGGFIDVPEERSIKNMAEEFMSTIAPCWPQRGKVINENTSDPRANRRTRAC